MPDDSKTHENLQRQAFRKMVHHIWSMIQAGLLDEMNDTESKMANILLDHPEYEDIFDDEGILDGREFDTDDKGNPFLHISIHKMVEDQIDSGSSEEVLFFLEEMEDKGYGRHEIIHVIMKILVRLISDAMASKTSLDAKRYRRMLERYRDLRLEEVNEALDRESLGH